MAVKAIQGGHQLVRKRRWAPKVRTGCLTCRHRHIKCDQGKPSCNRCLIAGLECSGNGYSPRIASPSWLLSLPAQPNYIASPFSTQPPPRERRMFYTFREPLLPNMFDVFDEGFWSITIPQASQVYPPVWHAAVACATLKSRLLIKENQKHVMTRDQEADLYGYALRHCNTSIQYLRQIRPSKPTYVDQEIVLSTCILLIYYSSLCGNHAEALTHIYNGLYLSKIWQPPGNSHSSSNSQRLPNCVTTAASIDIRFRRLEVLVLLSPFNIAAPPIPRHEPAILPDVPFSSLSDAYLELLFIDTKWKRVVRSDASAFGHIKLQFITDECQSLRLAFRIWQNKFHTLQDSMEPVARTGEVGRVEAVRRSAMHVLELVLEAMTSVDTTRGEVAWDDFNDNFERIIDHTRCMTQELGAAVLKKTGSDRTYLTDSSQFRSLVGLPLVAVGTFCRVPHLRRKAIVMLKTFPFLDGVFDSDFFVDVIGEKMRIEEQGTMLAPLEEGCQCIFNKFICNAHRVSQLTISPSRVMLRTGYNVAHNEAGVELIIRGN